MALVDINVAVKKLGRNPDATWPILLKSLPEGPAKQSLVNHSEEIVSLAKAVEQLQVSKKQESRSIGETRRAGLDVSARIVHMSVISEQLSQAQQTLHDRLAALGAELIVDRQKDTCRNDPCGTSLPHWFTPVTQPIPERSPARICAQSVRITDNFAESEWRDYTDNCRQATLHHDIRWRALIRETFGHDASYRVARDATGRVCGVLPLVRISSRLFGNYIVSMPYLNYGGPLADTPQIAEQLIDNAAAFAKASDCSHFEVRETASRVGWPQRKHKVAMLLRLPASVQEFEKSLDAKVRSQSRKAARLGACTVRGGTELLDDFYAVFSQNMRDLGTPVYSRAFFENILTTFVEECELVVVNIAGKPVAAALLMSHGSVVEVPWASSLREFRDTAVNMYLYYDILSGAIDRGFRWFDFGRSSKGAPTYRFKRQWGARAQPLYWHYWLADGDQPPALDPSNVRYRTMIATWQRLPLWLANRIGPSVVKNLP